MTHVIWHSCSERFRAAYLDRHGGEDAGPMNATAGHLSVLHDQVIQLAVLPDSGKLLAWHSKLPFRYGSSRWAGARSTF